MSEELIVTDDPRELGRGWHSVPFEAVTGKTITRVELVDDDEEVHFWFSDGSVARMWHDQDCCEGVRLVDGFDDLVALVGHPILQASEDSNSEDDKPDEWSESWTWTFYRLATLHGNATLRWLGESNGYYSEGVSFDMSLPSSPAALATPGGEE